jgi:hypothetical protein
MSTSDDDKTRMVRRSSSSSLQAGLPALSPVDDEGTVYVQPHGKGSNLSDDGTRIVQRGGTPPAPSQATPPSSDGHTVLVRPGSRNLKPSPAAASVAPASDDFPEDGPVVGWLVVVKGPGRGRSVSLGYGMNPIGRDADNRVSLPFNDEQISRKKHAVITYDPRGRKFYIQHGDSSNLSYVGEMPVLAPTLLEGGETIRFGDQTELRFVSLCGGEFTWEES